MVRPERNPHAHRVPRPAGFAMTEVLLAAAFVSLAILGLASSTLAGHRFAQSEEARGVALETTRAFLERLRSDEDWTGLYGRLWSKVDPQVVPAGSTWPPSVYYSDFETPGILGEVRVRVEVPAAPSPDAESGMGPYLREDVSEQRFGLPYDLNGDGLLDSQPRDNDYRALPVIVELHWKAAAGGVEQTIRTTAWLRGER